MLEVALNELKRTQSDWVPLVDAFVQSEFGQGLNSYLELEKALGSPIYPITDNIFRALVYSPFNKTKVIIVGQDPYPTPHMAQGLAFSAPSYEKTPRSLVNIFKELKMDLRKPHAEPQNNLTSWALQDVLLLNKVLTIGRESHKNKGWEVLTQEIINRLIEDKRPKVFMLWGNDAKDMVTEDRGPHLYLRAAHPSPLSASRGFFFQRQFSKCNKFLKESGYYEIDWMSIDTARSTLWRK